jgi:hypothetical protein
VQEHDGRTLDSAPGRPNFYKNFAPWNIDQSLRNCDGISHMRFPCSISCEKIQLAFIIIGVMYMSQRYFAMTIHQAPGSSHLRALCNNKESIGPAVILYVSNWEAWKRALKTFALAFLGGLLVFPIPLVHIFGAILVVTSPIAAIFVFVKSRGMIQGLSGSFDCPSCHAPNTMEYQEGKPPYYGSCQACKNPYQIYPESPRVSPE